MHRSQRPTSQASLCRQGLLIEKLFAAGLAATGILPWNHWKTIIVCKGLEWTAFVISKQSAVKSLKIWEIVHRSVMRRVLPEIACILLDSTGSSRQGHFSPSLSQNRAWDSRLTRLFSFSVKRILHIIELNLIIQELLPVVFLSTNEWAEPFAPFPLQKLLHYYDSVRHFITHRLPLEYLELHLRVRLIAHRNDSFSRSS